MSSEARRAQSLSVRRPREQKSCVRLLPTSHPKGRQVIGHASAVLRLCPSACSAGVETPLSSGHVERCVTQASQTWMPRMRTCPLPAQTTSLSSMRRMLRDGKVPLAPTTRFVKISLMTNVTGALVPREAERTRSMVCDTV